MLCVIRAKCQKMVFFSFGLGKGGLMQNMKDYQFHANVAITYIFIPQQNPFNPLNEDKKIGWKKTKPRNQKKVSSFIPGHKLLAACVGVSCIETVQYVLGFLGM